jgi:hypothetical protein
MRGNNADVTACDLQIGTEVAQGLLTFIFKVYEWVGEGEEKRREAAPPNANAYLPSYMSVTPHTTPQSPP